MVCTLVVLASLASIVASPSSQGPSGGKAHSGPAISMYGDLKY